MQKTGPKRIKEKAIVPIHDIKRIMKSLYQFPTLHTVDTLGKLLNVPRESVQYVMTNKKELEKYLRPDDLKAVRLD